MVHSTEDGRVAHAFADPQLDADARVQEEHGRQGQEEERHHDEGGVDLSLLQGLPELLTTHMVLLVHKVILHLQGRNKPGVYYRLMLDHS